MLWTLFFRGVMAVPLDKLFVYWMYVRKNMFFIFRRQGLRFRGLVIGYAAATLWRRLAVEAEWFLGRRRTFIGCHTLWLYGKTNRWGCQGGGLPGGKQVCWQTRFFLWQHNKKCEAWLAQANTELQWKFPLNRLKSSPRLPWAPPQGSSAGRRVKVRVSSRFEFPCAMGMWHWNMATRWAHYDTYSIA